MAVIMDKIPKQIEIEAKNTTMYFGVTEGLDVYKRITIPDTIAIMPIAINKILFDEFVPLVVNTKLFIVIPLS